MKKILIVIGARPQFIKLAPVSKALRVSGMFREVVVHTGQHYDPYMSSVFFHEMDIPEPQYNLEVKSVLHAEQTAMIMMRLEPIVIEENPDGILVFGDTNSTLAAALVAAKLNIPLYHVEAGLRSFNKKMPEEVNRILTDHVSAIHFAPTVTAVENLKKEGIAENVFHVGDVMYDAAVQFARKAEDESQILEKLSLEPKKYFLATIHRAENTDNRTLLENILTLLGECSQKNKVVLPLHPRTQKMIDKYGLNGMCAGITMVEPVGFVDMVRLEANAACIMTDSGGIQKEAYFHKVPCITLRKETEWVETVEAGWNMLLNPEMIRRGFQTKIDQFLESTTRREISDYGTGRSSHMIVEVLSAASSGSDTKVR